MLCVLVLFSIAKLSMYTCSILLFSMVLCSFVKWSMCVWYVFWSCHHLLNGLSASCIVFWSSVHLLNGLGLIVCYCVLVFCSIDKWSRPTCILLCCMVLCSFAEWSRSISILLCSYGHCVL